MYHGDEVINRVLTVFCLHRVYNQMILAVPSTDVANSSLLQTAMVRE